MDACDSVLCGATRKVLVSCDHFSKFTMMRLCAGKDVVSTDAVKLLVRWEALLGRPPLIVKFDNAPVFVSDLLTLYMRARGVEPAHAPAYNPPSNGVIERHVATAKAAIAAVQDSLAHHEDTATATMDGDDIVLFSELAMNGVTQECGFSAQQIVLGTGWTGPVGRQSTTTDADAADDSIHRDDLVHKYVVSQLRLVQAARAAAHSNRLLKDVRRGLKERVRHRSLASKCFTPGQKVEAQYGTKPRDATSARRKDSHSRAR